jgi:hypothetical protein
VVNRFQIVFNRAGGQHRLSRIVPGISVNFGELSLTF